MKKFTSRKFITALTGLITGIFLIIAGNITEGATTVASAVIAYCVSEGYVDGKKLSQSFDNTTKE